MRIFISWSKQKSKQLAEITKHFMEIVLGEQISFFLSPEMYMGTCADMEIHRRLIESDKCVVCLTADNFKNPWLMYESGVVYGANYSKAKSATIIPVLFEEIPDWSSWIDKPLNRYVPLNIRNNIGEFAQGKAAFYDFIQQIANSENIAIGDFNKQWEWYEKEVNETLQKEQTVPAECIDIVNELITDSNDSFILINPEITKNRITFYKGFETNTLIRILSNSVIEKGSRILWIYGRKNKKLLSRENESFFKYLADDKEHDVDFRCLFPMPNSDAFVKASSRDRASIFSDEIRISLLRAYELKKKFNLPVESMFRLYTECRTESVIRIDNTVLYRFIIRDSEGFPLPYTDSQFNVFSAIEGTDLGNTGIKACEKINSIWNDQSKSVALTSELLENLYGSILNIE